LKVTTTSIHVEPRGRGRGRGFLSQIHIAISLNMSTSTATTTTAAVITASRASFVLGQYDGGFTTLYAYRTLLFRRQGGEKQ
jgi:hypothetical protein